MTRRFATARRLSWLGSLLLLVCTAAHAEIRVEIIVDCDPSNIHIAVADLSGGSPELDQFGVNFSKQVTSEPEDRGIFGSIPRAAFIQPSAESAITPRFGDWRVIGTEILVTGTAKIQSEGCLLVDVRVWDVLAEQEMTNVAIADALEQWSVVAHRIACSVSAHCRRTHQA